MGLLDFIAKPMEDVVNAVEGAAIGNLGQHSGQLPPIRSKQNGAVSQTASNLEQTAQVPIQQTAHAVLPKIVPDVTTKQQNQAEQGAEFGMGAVQGQPEADALSPSLDVGLDTAKTAVKAGAQDVKETMQTAQTQPGGLQAGFVKNPFSKTDSQGSPVQLHDTDLHKEYGYSSPKRVAEVQQTLDTVKGTNPSEVYKNMQPTIDGLGKQIDQVTMGNPSTASKSYPNGVTYQDLADLMYQKANEQGLLKDPAVAKKVKQGIAEQINYIAGKGENPEALSNKPIFDNNLTAIASPQGDVLAQKPLDMQTLRSEYLQANLDNKAILSKATPMRPLSAKDKAQLLYRNSLKDTIGATSSQVADLISKQHDLYDAEEPVLQQAKAYEKSQTPTKGQPRSAWDIAKTVGEIGIGGYGINQGLKAFGIDIPGLVRAGVVKAEDAFNNKNNSVPNNPGGSQIYSQPTDNKYYANQTHITSSSIPRTQADVKPDSYGNYPIANPQNIDTQYGYPVAMNKAFHDSQLSKLQGQQNTDKALYGESSLQYANDTTAIERLNNIYNGSPDIQKAYNNSAKVSSLVAKVKSEVSGLSDSLLQNTTFDQLSSINNGQYRGLKNDIVTLAQSYGIDPSLIWQQQDSKALNGTLDSIGQQNSWNWANYINGLTGNSGASNLASPIAQGAGTISGTPLPSMKPQGKVQIFNGGSSQQLPPMPNFQQVGSQFAQ